MAAAATSGAATVIRVPSEHATIQLGVNAAGEGDTVLVAPGVYTGVGNRDIDFGGVDLVLLSEEGSSETAIDCQASGRAFFLHSGETLASVIEGFTIADGSSPRGACGVSSSSKLTRNSSTARATTVLSADLEPPR